ncbi:N-acetylmuramoyl-L-alanine amidase [Nakamurella silvestris]|nr:N-acetylmuramoyl-L-alanine amidase [Nakamurella silvestris]
MLVRRGDRGPSVAAIRSTLASLGMLAADLDTDDVDVIFDDELLSAVRVFQQQRGLVADGLVGPSTIRALDEARWTLGDRILTYTLSAPMIGDDVAALQARLSELGYNTGQVDGVFGPKTDNCVREFQRHRGLAGDGVFGPGTARELSRMGRMVTGGRQHRLRERELVRLKGPDLRGKRIIIDPSHGGDDPGWVEGEWNARDLVFDIAHRLEGRMTATGMETFLTHGPQENPSAEERAKRANSLEGDLLISLHIDGWRSPYAQGLAAFHFGTDSGQSSTIGENLANLIQRELLARTGFLDCLVHHRPWDILRLTQMPTVQLEMGYLSNPSDRASLVREDFRDTLAEGILVGVKRLYLDGRDEPHTGTMNFKDLLEYELKVRGG